jgi:hypothetical protein
LEPQALTLKTTANISAIAIASCLLYCLQLSTRAHQASYSDTALYLPGFSG